MIKMNEELVQAMNKVLGNTFVMYYKTHSYHWNVEGRSFFADHTFLEEIYTEVYGAVDAIAEHIRQLDAFTPTSLMKLKQYSSISEDDTVVGSTQMISNLLAANDVVLLTLMQAYKLAEAAGELGASNFLQDRITAHQKHRWMLKASLK
jgi:starvation-inducible DNA-binding protein